MDIYISCDLTRIDAPIENTKGRISEPFVTGPVLGRCRNHVFFAVMDIQSCFLKVFLR